MLFDFSCKKWTCTPYTPKKGRVVALFKLMVESVLPLVTVKRGHLAR